MGKKGRDSMCKYGPLDTPESMKIRRVSYSVFEYFRNSGLARNVNQRGSGKAVFSIDGFEGIFIADPDEPGFEGPMDLEGAGLAEATLAILYAPEAANDDVPNEPEIEVPKVFGSQMGVREQLAENLVDFFGSMRKGIAYVIAAARKALEGNK